MSGEVSAVLVPGFWFVVVMVCGWVTWRDWHDV